VNELLVDAGSLIAIFDRSDKHHRHCAEIAETLNEPFVTTFAVLAEAFYILGGRLGWIAQEALWLLINRADIIVIHPSREDLVRMSELMDKYRDLPMDFADASLVALAERLGTDRVFTVDNHHFRVYRRHGKSAFTVLGPPSPKSA